MRILITGATGLVGRNLVALCRERGIGVNYLTTRRETVERGTQYRGFYWNPDENYLDPHCFDGVSAIVNLAGTPISERWTKKRRQDILMSRINSIRTLARGLKQRPAGQVGCLISASAIGIYPDSLSEFYTETEPQVDDSFLGEVVAAWEKEVDSLYTYGMHIAKVRIGLVLSAEGGALPEMARPIRYYMGAAFATGEQWQSWIHIEDLSRMFLFLLESKEQGIFNGVAPNPVTNSKLIREIADVLNKPLLIPNIPKYILKLILGEMAYLLYASQRVSCKKVEDAGFEFKFANISRALQDIYNIDRQDTEEAYSPINENSGR